MIGITRDADVVTIELQREERRNALNAELCERLRDAIDKAADDDARAIVLTGRGSVFCAGADLSEVYSDSFTETLLGMLHTIDAVPVPVIAAINGAALGAGTQLAIASDLRVVGPDAFFGVPAAKLGITVDRWTVHRLASLVGSGPARTMMLGLESLTAEDAYRYGLANKLGTLADAQAWAHKIAQLAPLTMQHLKLVFNDDGTQDTESPDQRAALYKAWLSDDAKEGRLAHKEKRQPKFIGR
ncbi:enoyl-CoA hydratase [Antrihabitans spumae]|jgi:enoyl-CoA hydratase|uniref:Enoyl-CoA hydratase n=1 Tax=Antrihabitans spumae TaxID=3373370 RepID=A0ABW7JPU2_9NOCA